jgi:glycosyltransferase involved in cell wall biosynthesis
MQSRPRLLILSDANSAHTIRWVGALASRGYSIALYSLASPQAEHYADTPSVRVFSLGLQPAFVQAEEGAAAKLRYAGALLPVRRLMHTFAPDIVHAHYATSYGLIATLAAARPRIVSVWGMDVYGLASRSHVARLTARAVLNSADAILSTSSVMKTKVCALTRRPVDVTPFGIDVRRFAPSHDRHGVGEITVGIVKSLEAKYGVEYLLRAFALVLQSGSLRNAYRLVVVGGGSQRQYLETLASTLGVSARVDFVGPCNYDEVHRWHQAFDIAVYPSIEESESFGVSVLESQASGVPVIVSDIGGLPEVILPGASGLLVPPRDPVRLANAIATLGENEAMRRDFGEAARRHVVERYSLDECVQRMERVYERTLRARGSAMSIGRPTD